MIPKLGNLGGNLTQALSFENIKADLFDFELPPNPAMSDFYTLVKGSGAATDNEMPSPDAVQKAVTKKRPPIKVPEQLPFALPPPGLKDLAAEGQEIVTDLAQGATGQQIQQALDSYG